VARSFDRLDLRSTRECGRESLGVGGGYDPVLAAPQEQRVGDDPVQSLVKSAISSGPEQARRGLVRPGQQDLPLDGVDALWGLEERREFFA